MNTSKRVNVYLKDEANHAIEVLFEHLKEIGDIPSNASLDDIGKYRAQIITYALLQVTGEKGKSNV